MAEETSVPENREDSSVPENREDSGKFQYGCEHYRRRCRIRAPCCNRVFTCRHCRNEAMNLLSNPKERHELVRHDVAKFCSKCGVSMGDYFCEVCKFYDDEVDKRQFHCDECGICRVGGREKFFHCPKCGSCYSMGLRDNHLCVENAMKNCCPICYEYLFDLIKGTTVMRCGHTIHMECYREMLYQKQYRCPICFTSTLDMSRSWERLDQELKK